MRSGDGLGRGEEGGGGKERETHDTPPPPPAEAAAGAERAIRPEKGEKKIRSRILRRKKRGRTRTERLQGGLRLRSLA